VRGPNFGGHEHLVAVDAGSAQPLADLAFVFVDLSGIDMAIAEPERLLDQTRASAPAQFEPDYRNLCAIGFNELHRGFPYEWDSLALRCAGCECGKHHLRRMGDDGEKRARGSPRHALALLTVADGFDGHAEPGGEFDLGQPRAAAKIASGWGRRCIGRRDGGQRRRKRKLAPVPQLDDPSVRFQPQTLHVDLSA
jgi:hypothetical protein